MTTRHKVILILVGIGAFFILQKPAFPQPENIRDYFFEVHMEPSNANESMFNVLTKFVNLADQYNVNLTLLFTPQWAEMILKDSKKLSLLNQWKQNGHEIGGHHHGPTVCPWDGYTNLEYASQEFKNRQNRVPCPSFVREQEKYSGNMEDYMKLLSKLGTIKTITMSDEDVDWPKDALYAAGGRHLQEAISQSKMVIFNGHKVYKLTSCPLEPKKLVTGIQITIDELKNAYLSEREGIFGVGNHPEGYKDNPNLYRQWFEFLKEQDPEMVHSKTIFQIIETL